MVQLVNGNREATKEYWYDAFGVEEDIDEGDTNPFRYCGEYYDSSSGSYYLRNRYYNPSTGRFLTEDPIRAGNNWYTYANNNPIMFIDPFGLDAYIYYLPEWKDEALNDQKELMKYYNLTEAEVHLYEISGDNAYDNFVSNWNSMGLDSEGNVVEIHATVINTHASPSALTDNKQFRLGALDIESLANKKMGALILYGCNSGHIDSPLTNPASRFAMKVDGSPVVASDGTVYSGHKMFSETMIYDSRNDSSFKNFLINNKKRDNSGRVIYQQQEDDNWIYSYPYKSKKLTLKQILDGVYNKK